MYMYVSTLVMHDTRNKLRPTPQSTDFPPPVGRRPVDFYLLPILFWINSALVSSDSAEKKKKERFLHFFFGFRHHILYATRGFSGRKNYHHHHHHIYVSPFLFFFIIMHFSVVSAFLLPSSALIFDGCSDGFFCFFFLLSESFSSPELPISLPPRFFFWVRRGSITPRADWPSHTSTHGVREGNLLKKALRLGWITFNFSFTFLGCSFLPKAENS